MRPVRTVGRCSSVRDDPIAEVEGPPRRSPCDGRVSPMLYRGVMQTMTRSAARRTAIAATGLDRPRPATVTARHLRSVFATMGVTQIDSVARVIRSHYLPFFSRLGPYQRATLDRLLYSSPRMGVEYWAHAAAFVPPETWKHFSRSRAEWWLVDYGQRHPETGEAFRNLQSSVLAALEEGPRSGRDVSEVVAQAAPASHRGHCGWHPSQVNVAPEALSAGGIISSAGCTDPFERIYALTRAVAGGPPELPLSYGTGARPRL